MQPGGFVSRTFTPMMWDNVIGQTKFLAYVQAMHPPRAGQTRFVLAMMWRCLGCVARSTSP